MVPKNFQDRQICIVGLGFVGITLSAAMADCGFDVYGVEIRDEVLKSLKKGEPHFHEPGLADMLKRVIAQGNFHVEKHIPKNISSRVFFITVGTPLGPDGRVRMDMIKNVAEEVSKNLKDGDMVILRSTVKLGATRNIILPILEKSGKKFDLAFCPERTVEGYAISELRQLPQIVGGLDLHSSVRAAQLFQFITPSVVQVSDLETAEMIKLVDNSHRDVYLAYGNEVARMCDAVGINAVEVVQMGKLGYPRTNVYMPGPVGGPCLEKDPHILAESLESYGIKPEISQAARLVNERQPKEVAEQILQFAQLLGFPSRAKITLLGIAFKGRPETDDLRGTMARPIFEELKKKFPNAIFRAFDPVVSKKDLKNFGIDPCFSLEEAFKGSSLAIILNNHPLFGKMPLSELANSMARPAVIYDFWNNFSSVHLTLPSQIYYTALGLNGGDSITQYAKKNFSNRRDRIHRISARKETGVGRPAGARVG